MEICFVDSEEDAMLYRKLGAERIAAAICEAITGRMPDYNKEDNEMIYNYIDENMPEWARSTIQKLVNRGLLKGDGSGLNLDSLMLRILVINDRTGIYENDIKKITNAIEQTELIKLIAPTAREYLVYEISQDETNQEVVAKIEALDLIKEINAITEVLVEVIDTCSDIEIQLDKPQDILLNETLAIHIDAIMDKTFKSDIINYIAMPYAIEAMTNALTEEYSGLLDILTEENIKTCLQSDVSSLLTVYQDLAKYNNLHNFLFYEEDIDIIINIIDCNVTFCNIFFIYFLISIYYLHFPMK